MRVSGMPARENDGVDSLVLPIVLGTTEPVPSIVVTANPCKAHTGRKQEFTARCSTTSFSASQ